MKRTGKANETEDARAGSEHLIPAGAHNVEDSTMGACRASSSRYHKHTKKITPAPPPISRPRAPGRNVNRVPARIACKSRHWCKAKVANQRRDRAHAERKSSHNKGLTNVRRGDKTSRIVPDFQVALDHLASDNRTKPKQNIRPNIKRRNLSGRRNGDEFE